MFGHSGLRRTAAGHCAGVALMSAFQQAPADARISQADFKKASLRVAEELRAAGIAAARALTGGWVDWFNSGNPVEPAR